MLVDIIDVCFWVFFPVLFPFLSDASDRNLISTSVNKNGNSVVHITEKSRVRWLQVQICSGVQMML